MQVRQESTPVPDQKNSSEDSIASLEVSVPSKLPGTNLMSGNTLCLLKTAIAEIHPGPIRCKAQYYLTRVHRSPPLPSSLQMH